jgi:hypothetical protein
VDVAALQNEAPVPPHDAIFASFRLRSRDNALRDDAAGADWSPAPSWRVYPGLLAFAPIPTAVIYASDT